MKRKAIIIKESSDGRRSVAVDEENAEELLKFFRQDKRYQKKFNHICEFTPVQNGVINSGNTIILMVSRNMFSQSCAKYHAEFR
jgi:hypothetical protein